MRSARPSARRSNQWRRPPRKRARRATKHKLAARARIVLPAREKPSTWVAGRKAVRRVPRMARGGVPMPGNRRLAAKAASQKPGLVARKFAAMAARGPRATPVPAALRGVCVAMKIARAMRVDGPRYARKRLRAVRQALCPSGRVRSGRTTPCASLAKNAVRATGVLRGAAIPLRPASARQEAPMRAGAPHRRNKRGEKRRANAPSRAARSLRRAVPRAYGYPS